MGYSLSQSFISGQPPLLVFTICLTAFGLTMVILAYVIGEQDVPNPDVQMDWNKFFKKMSSFKLCPVQNETRNFADGHFKENKKSSFHSDTVLNTSLHVVDASKSMSAVLSNIGKSPEDEHINFVEIPVRVQFKLLGKIHPSSFFQVKGKIKGSLLGFTGKYASLIFNVSLNFISPINNSCDGESCSSVWEVCLVMSIPADLLYETKNPDRCDSKIITVTDSLPIFYIDVKKSEKEVSGSSCLALSYTPDSKLTEMLSVHERSIVNLHLMHTSYFMFVMVMTLVCFSLIRGRYPRNSHLHEKAWIKERNWITNVFTVWNHLSGNQLTGKPVIRNDISDRLISESLQKKVPLDA